MVDPRSVRAFVERDWARVARDKEAYWRDERRAHGAAAAIRVADALRLHVRRARPDWPSDAERQEDLETHARVFEVIRRARRVGR